MNVQSNTYTFIYSSVLVIVSAFLLAVAAISLQPTQQRNIEIEKKQNILSSVRVISTPKDAEELYDKYIVESFVITPDGKKVKDADAFTIDLKVELEKKPDERQLPVFKCVKEDSTFLIAPLRGKGLWGPIWGYISFIEEVKVIKLGPKVTAEVDTLSGDTLRTEQEENVIRKKYYKTVYAAFYDHKGETPGLGAEINQGWFLDPFQGKQIFDEKGEFVSVKVVKGGVKAGSTNEVDIISGGTITSKGVEAMLDSCLINYVKYFKNEK